MQRRLTHGAPRYRLAAMHQLGRGQRHPELRGFTLVELMAVVVIVGVLATVGITLFRKHIYSAKGTEALGMVQSIRAAEERWKAETNAYLSVSPNLSTLYPMDDPGRDKFPFYGGSNVLGPRWALLRPTAPAVVQFGYAVVAGPPGNVSVTTSTKQQPNWGASNQNWYVIQATGDTNGDDVNAYYLASSFTGEVYWENEGE